MIGIYDSGIGGLSIYKAIKKKLPYEDFIYIADKKFFPYGKQTDKTIQRRGNKIVSWFENQKVSLIVVACNTATVSSLSYLRKKHPDTPIVGTVPVIKKCSETTKNGIIGILCTPKTKKSSYNKNLIAEFAKNKKVYVKAVPKLVKVIESGNIDEASVIPIIKPTILSLMRRGVDTLALGCSHFPLVNDHIKSISGKNILVLDSSDAVARQTKRVLEQNKTITSGSKIGRTKFFTTGNNEKFAIIISRYLHKKIETKNLDI